MLDLLSRGDKLRFIRKSRGTQLVDRRRDCPLMRLVKRSDRGIDRPVHQGVQARRRELRLFIQHQQVAVYLRDLDDAFEHVLLRNPSTCVFRL